MESSTFNLAGCSEKKRTAYISPDNLNSCALNGVSFRWTCRSKSEARQFDNWKFSPTKCTWTRAILSVVLFGTLCRFLLSLTHYVVSVFSQGVREVIGTCNSYWSDWNQVLMLWSSHCIHCHLHCLLLQKIVLYSGSRLPASPGNGH